MKKTYIRELTFDELKEFILTLGEKPYAASQVFDWLHKKGVGDFESMTNLSKAMRAKLNENAYLEPMQILQKFESTDEGVCKYLFGIDGKLVIEAVLMKYSYGNTVCISSQAGCKMGCAFCASTLTGLDRNLTAGEMLAQVYNIQKDSNERVSNIVVMGLGEPFDNYGELMKFLQIINDERGLCIGQRSITVSTCGVADRIRDFADVGFQANLAVSLHAPNDDIRKLIMPVARKYSYKELLSACDYYTRTTKRRITYEYALIEGVNDSPECARELAALIKGTLCHVNLIGLNSIAGDKFRGSSEKAKESFAQILKSYGIETTIRRKKGVDINAACGQLKYKFIEPNIDSEPENEPENTL